MKRTVTPRELGALVRKYRKLCKTFGTGSWRETAKQGSIIAVGFGTKTLLRAVRRGKNWTVVTAV